MNFVVFPKPDLSGWLLLAGIAFNVAAFIVGAANADAATVIISGSCLCFVAGSVKVGPA